MLLYETSYTEGEGIGEASELLRSTCWNRAESLLSINRFHIRSDRDTAYSMHHARARRG